MFELVSDFKGGNGYYEDDIINIMHRKNGKSSAECLKKFPTVQSSPDKVRKNVRTKTFQGSVITIQSNLPLSTDIAKPQKKQNNFIHRKIQSFLPTTFTEPSSTTSFQVQAGLALSSRRRMQSLENLLNKCYDIQNDFRSEAALKKAKKLKNGFGELRKTVEEIQDFYDSDDSPVIGKDKWLDKEASKLDQLKKFKPKPPGQYHNKWNHKICIISRSTSKLVANVASNINKRNGFL